MGIQARRERERQELRQAMLTATLDLAAEQGWPAVTVRKVAERIEYSPGMLYEYFDGKEALLTALLQEGYTRLLAEMEVAISAAETIEDRLLAITHVYWYFALANPALYRVMHGLDGVPFCADDESPEMRRVVSLTADAIRELTGSLPEDELMDLVDLAWATLHGLVSLVLAQQLPGGAERGLLLVDRHAHDLITAWRSRRHQAQHGKHEG
jgi:AcrR family transcriptional regulator